MTKKISNLQDHIIESKKDLAFLKEWNKSELPYQISRQIISLRMAQKLTQQQLADRVKTTQAVISRIENMTTNPSVMLLERIARAMGRELSVSL